jgi:hypothetical protein
VLSNSGRIIQSGRSEEKANLKNCGGKRPEMGCICRITCEITLFLINKNRATSANCDLWVPINYRPSKTSCGIPYTKGVRSSSATLCCRASLIFPIASAEKWDVNSPNRDDFSRFDAPGLVDHVSPHNVPTGVVVVRL